MGGGIEHLGLILAFSLGLGPVQAAETVWIANFSSENLAQWDVKSFVGQTQYQLMTLDNTPVLQATSRRSASGLGKKIRVDLNKTPYLHWSWRVENRYPGLNEQSKAGDDYPARVYVVVDGGLAFWKTKALNYVWSSNQAIGSHWPNAFTRNAQMLAVRGKTDPLQHWVTEKQDIKADFKRLFGQEIQAIDGVAIMTDSDNASGQATSYYGNIYFSDQ